MEDSHPPTRASFTVTGSTLELLRQTAAEADLSANEVALGLVRDGLAAVHADSRTDVGMVVLLRKALRKDLTAGDKLIQGWLEVHYPTWAEQTAEYRRLLVKMASQMEDLDAKAIKRAADAAWAIVQAKAKGGTRRRALARANATDGRKN